MSVNYSLKFFFCLLVTGLLCSCNGKKDLKGDNLKFEEYITLEDNGEDIFVKVSHRLDEKLVNIGAFSFDDDNLFFHTHLSRNENSTEGELIAYAFTSEDKYYQFSDKKGLNLREWEEAAKHLSKYAEENGFIALAENEGVVSNKFIEYQNEYLKRVGLYSDSNARVGFTNVFRNGCVQGGGNSNGIFGAKPFFAFGVWRNSISRMFSFSLFGSDIIFDGSFFRRRIGTITRSGWQTLCFDNVPGWSVTGFTRYNDRAESWIKAF